MSSDDGQQQKGTFESPVWPVAVTNACSSASHVVPVRVGSFFLCLPFQGFTCKMAQLLRRVNKQEQAKWEISLKESQCEMTDFNHFRAETTTIRNMKVGG